MFKLKTSTAAIALMLTTATAFSQENTSYDIKIAPQKLTEALTKLSDIAHIQLIYSPEQLQGIKTEGAAGRLTSLSTLERLLADTDLILNKIDETTYVITNEAAGGNKFQTISYGEDYVDNLAVSEDDERAIGGEEMILEEVIVTGSQIKGVRVTGALPVTVVGAEEIQAIGAISGDDLFRSIPQMGDVSFNQTSGQVSSNFARGDVGSIDLRGLGIGNTLVLINGRRTVTYPSSQASGSLSPVLTYNSNAIPVTGVERLEVLRDGASAIYGSDAVAGVVNTILFKDYEGAKIDGRFGFAEGTNQRAVTLNAVYGTDIGDGRGNVSLFANYTNRSALQSSDLEFAASGDKRPLFVGTEFEGSNSLDNRSTTTPWGVFQTSPGTVVAQNGTNLTNSSGIFHLQPSTNTGCRTELGAGICVDDGFASTTSVDRNLRWDPLATYPISVMPKVDRINLFATGHYDLTDDIELFGEAGFYRAVTKSVQDSIFTIGSIRMTIPSTNYWNPFGPVTFADGTPNPNRLAGIDAPDEGLDLILRTLRLSDLGPTEVKVKSTQVRFLAGLRGEAYGVDWETAVLYSEGNVSDEQNGISATAFQQNLALSTPDAFNPFNGGDVNNPGGFDTTISNQAALDAISIISLKKAKSTLTSWDLRLSKADLATLWAGDIGMAAGIEYRRETQFDDRDPNVDGASQWYDTELDILQPSNLFGVSPTPDNKGSRNIISGFVELAVPLVSPDMSVPLMRSLDIQLAGRFERYSDFGSIAKPKIAMAWDVVDGVRFRGSYSEGFRAPNLEQVNAKIITRGNTRTDYVRCEADLRAGRIAAFSDCSRNVVATSRRAGNPDLEAEESRNYTLGVVLQPTFLPESMGDIIVTADYWKIQQTGIVGIFGGANALIEDYLLRLQGGSNSDVVREAPTADDIADFAGTGIDPVGEVRFVNDQYRNLEPQDVQGFDMSLQWHLDTDIGAWSFRINAAKLLKYERDVSPEVQVLLDAREAGVINAGTTISEGGDLIRQNGNPEWRGSASLSWAKGPLSLRVFANYTDGFDDTSLRDSEGDPFQVASYTTVNLSGNYDFSEGTLEGTKLGFGVRNIFDKAPPIADETFGYRGSVNSPLPRYWYVSVSKKF